MITSKQIIQISEQWIKTDISDFTDREFDIFINPTSSDFLDMIKTAKEGQRSFNGIRFVADNKSKKVYAADASITTHYDIEKAMGLPEGVCNGTQVEGLATISGGQAKIEDFYNGGPTTLKKFRSIDWTWVDKYIKGCSAYIGN